MTASAREAFRKLLKTAYELALTPSMPLKHFEVLVKCQKQNGVKLIQGKQDGRTAKEFVHCISEAIVEKVAVILASSNFMSVLSDGSQARRTGSEKDLILTRIERGGLPCYFLISLAEMSDFGDTDAESIKKAIDHSFLKEINISESSFLNCLVGATADGASVNTGKYRGVLTQLKNKRPWLITIHCVNHRIELAVKEAMNIPFIREIESFYNGNYTLLKRSGALKAEQAVRTIQQVAKDLMKILRERFADFEDPILLSMQWLDPNYWIDSKDYGIDQILNLYDTESIFKVPLDEAGFNANRVGREWRLLRAFITSFYINAVLKNPLSLDKIWQNIIKFRQNEYPNVCLLVSLLSCLSGSNSTIECAFSVLNLILGDRRLSLGNQAMKDIMIVKCNDRNWGFQEKK